MPNTYQPGDRLIARNDDHELHGIYLGKDQVITYPVLPSPEYQAYSLQLFSLDQFQTHGVVTLCLNGSDTPSAEYVLNRALSCLVDKDLAFVSSEEFADWCHEVSYPAHTTVPDCRTPSNPHDLVDVALKSASLAIPFLGKRQGLILGAGLGIAGAINEALRD